MSRDRMSDELLTYLRRAVGADRDVEETDSELLARFARERDERAFEILLARHAPMVLGVCRRLLPTGQDAEDAFQATFLALARTASTRRWDSSVANWLFTTARQVALNVRRAAARRHRREQRSSSCGNPPQDPLEELSGREMLAVLDAELARLPERLRAPLLLCCLQGLSRDEAAAQLGLPLGTLKSRLERGRAALHSALARRGLAPAGLTLLALTPPAGAVSSQVLRSILTAVVADATGSTAAIPAAVLSLRDEVLNMMWLTRLKVASGLLVVSTLVAAAAVSGLALGSRATGADSDSPAGARKPHDVRREKPELHVVGVFGTKKLVNGGEVSIDVRLTARPVVLVLTSYFPVTWRVRTIAAAKVEKVIVSGYFAQEVVELPPGVPLVNRSYFPADGSRRAGGWFHAYQWNSAPYREMVRRLNEMTRLPVASFQGAYEGTTFVIDGKSGRERGQRRLPSQAPAAADLTREALRAACAGAELHVVGVYGQKDPSRPVDVEVPATPRPVVLAMTAYNSVVWNVKAAPGARIRAVVASGYFSQEVDGVPPGVPFYRSGPDPSSHFGPRAGPRAREYFYAYAAGTDEYRRAAAALLDLTGLPVATFQGEYSDSAFVVDGTRGRAPAQSGGGTAGPRDGVKAGDVPADIAEVPSRDLEVGGNAKRRYLLIGPKAGVRRPREGYGLLVVLPGGDGGAGFLPFVKRVYRNAIPEGYLVAQIVAPRWTADQRIVWPTRSNPVPKMRFTTEELIEAVVADVAAAHRVDRSRVFALGWSSSGPAVYAATVRERGSLAGALIAMSVFNPKFLPPLAGAKGRAFYLYHSREDRLCPYRMAETARDRLKEQGAAVHLATYEGGHGWRGDVYGDLRAGLRWLEANRRDRGSR